MRSHHLALERIGRRDSALVGGEEQDSDQCKEQTGVSKQPLLELDPKHGGLAREDVLECLLAADEPCIRGGVKYMSKYAIWGLDAEVTAQEQTVWQSTSFVVAEAATGAHAAREAEAERRRQEEEEARITLRDFR